MVGPKISVCLPVFNGERYLAQAIESILAQSFTDFEILIGDDQSTDSSSAIISKFQSNDKRIIAWQNDHRKGLFANYNECMSRASGEFIKPFAQDDLLEPTALENLARLLEENDDVSLVSCAKSWIDNTGKVIQEIKAFAEDQIINGNDVVKFNLVRLTNWVGEPATVMFRRELIGAGFDEAFHHYGDIEYWFRILRNHNFGFISQPLCSFRRHSDSATSKNLTGLLIVLDILRINELYSDVLKEFGESYEHSAKRTVEIIAMQLDHLVRVEHVDLKRITLERYPIVQKNNCDPREKLYWTLRKITRVLSEIDDLKCSSVSEREHLQNQIDDLCQSTSWKITSPIRLISALRKPTNLPEQVFTNFDSQTTSLEQYQAGDLQGFDKATRWAEQYLSEKQHELAVRKEEWQTERQQLEQKLYDLKSSASWKISAPLRQISKRIGALENGTTANR